MTKDSWPGNTNRPLSINGWNYVEANPINRIDPSGQYFWGPGDTLLNSAATRFQNQNIQVRIQAIYMFEYGSMKRIHAEYRIPDTNFPVDLLDSDTGEMWEIKPWDQREQAEPQLTLYLAAMAAARRTGHLEGTTPIGTHYDWNSSPLRWLPGEQFPPEIYVGTDDTGFFHIFAGQVNPGVIAWWKYKSPQPIPVPIPVYVPNNMKWNERNKRPGWAPQPGFASSLPLGILEPGEETFSPIIDCQENNDQFPEWLLNLLENIQLQLNL